MPENVISKPLTYDIVHEGETTIVKCQGRLITGFVDELYEEIKRSVPTTKLLIMDLAELKFVDSMGLGMLVRLYVHTQGTPCQLQVLHLGKQLRNLLKMTNLTSTFSTAEDHGITVA